MELFLVQILAEVATNQMKSLTAEVEKGSITTLIDDGRLGPKRQGKRLVCAIFTNRRNAKGKQVNILVVALWRLNGRRRKRDPRPPLRDELGFSFLINNAEMVGAVCAAPVILRSGIIFSIRYSLSHWKRSDTYFRSLGTLVGAWKRGSRRLLCE